jgi:uncharacterized protein YbbC (DUF1343 family)
MKLANHKIILLGVFFVITIFVQAQPIAIKPVGETLSGATDVSAYLPLLKNKKVGVVANQSSLIGSTHLVDSLIALDINILKVFTPEHGFRGDADAGAHIVSGKDSRTGLELISLYGNHKKPTAEDLNQVEVVLFDLQDVGVRFYTYISTLSYVMEACAAYEIPVIVLDRPNPNGFYIDGPILDKQHSSFVGLHPVPIVYGMTIGEYALMVNGEKWMQNQLECDLTVVPLRNYDRSAIDELAIKPSPNLPNYQSIFLYPSLCLFEGTAVSIGRGTDFPFQVYGHPDFPESGFSFIPESRPGATNPKHLGKSCNGYDLRNLANKPDKKLAKLNLSWILEAYQDIEESDFFNAYFEKLAGSSTLRQQIIEGETEENIRASWQSGLEQFRKIRSKYLIYPDFNQ